VRTADVGDQATKVAEETARAGDRPDFRIVFESELPFVWNTLRRFGVADRDLEDVAHEVFVVVNRRLGEYDPARPLRPWLFAIAFRCASDYRRLSRHRHETLEGDAVDPVDGADAPDEIVGRAEERNLARRALLAVPEERRAVLVLHDFEEVAMHDVADALGIPLKTAYSRLRIGRIELIDAARREQRGKEGP
jgi:RNA polymerase sigma-70 factor (ECF subfamily)